MQASAHDPLRASTDEQGSEWLRIGGVALAVRDLDRVAAFYRDVVGLEVIARADDGIRMGVAGDAFLDLLHRPDAAPDDPASAGLFHTAFLLPSRPDLGRWLAHVHALGQKLDGAADHLVSEAAYLHDPEGNGIEVYADRPRAQWGWHDGPDGRRVEMANRPLDAEGLLGLADAPWAGAPAGTRIGHVHLRVGAVGEARRFYGDLLGLDVTVARDAAAFLSSGGYHHHIAANVWRSAGAGPRDPARAGLASVTLDIADEQARAGIMARTGARTGAMDHVGDGVLHDPWGTIVRLRLARPPQRLASSVTNA
jgi:catechol 2,3-dioxygenase